MRRLWLVFLFTFAANGPIQAVESAEIQVTPEQRTELHVSVYMNGTGLVSDYRSVPWPGEAADLAFEGVSRQIVPSSALMSSSGGSSVTAIDYDFDLLTPDALLQRAIGEEVGVVQTHPTTGEETVEQATVLNAENGVVLRFRDRVETGIPGRLVFDRVPAGLRTSPTLLASLDGGPRTDGNSDLALQLTYLTNGLAWQADYAVQIDDAMERMDIQGRAMIENTSGTDFRDAKLSLIAGDVRKAHAPTGAEMTRATRGAARYDMALTERAAPTPAREAVNDLHVYRLPEPVTLADRENKQVALLNMTDVPVSRIYVSESRPAVYRVDAGDRRPQNADIVLRFENSGAGAETPLPAGIIRVYTRDQGGVRRLLGEDRLASTPVGSTAEIEPGRAFDVTVEREQTDFVRAGLPKNVYESAHNVTVRNAKDEPVTVKVVEHISPQWTILEESTPHVKEAADRAVWQVDVDAKGVAELTYRVRVQQ